MIEELKTLETNAQNELSELTDPEKLKELKIKYLGRKGVFASVASQISKLEPAERPLAGKEMNRIKQTLEALFESKEKTVRSGSGAGAERLDTTMPGTFPALGRLHPITRVIFDITEIFERLGFTATDGPEVETEYHNFEALNVPLDHPSRDGLDTFYLENGKLLRSQTSTVQIRFMEQSKPPFKIIAPGKVYRPDATDATHAFMFHQIEGLMVDREVSFSDLKGVLSAFTKAFFGPETKVRFRPHFFPFTEPSAEMDIFSKSRGWLEILGAGMVHPNVLRAVKINPEKFSGFAFGMGVERIAMMKYGVEDIRQFFENDIRFLRQF